MNPDGMTSGSQKGDENIWQGFPENENSLLGSNLDSVSESSLKLLKMLKKQQGSQERIHESVKYCIEKDRDLNPALIEEIISTCPESIRDIIKIINERSELSNNIYEAFKFLPHAHIFVGPPGVGKSDLALVIALKCRLGKTIIAGQILSTEFQNSGQSNITRLLGPILDIETPHVVILDELHTIVKKKNNDDYNTEAAEALWLFIDRFKRKNNLLIIATSNDLKILPEQLKTRVAGGIHHINRPNAELRERHINHFLKKYNYSNTFDISQKDIKSILRQIKDFTVRDIKEAMKKGLWLARIRCQKEADNGSIVYKFTKKDFEQGIVFVKANNEHFKPLYKSAYEYCKPHIGPMFHMVVPLIFNGGINYYFHRQNIALTLKGMDKQKEFHSQSMDLQREGLAQALRFYEEPHQLTMENIVKQTSRNTVGLISYAAIPLGLLYVLKKIASVETLHSIWGFIKSYNYFN